MMAKAKAKTGRLRLLVIGWWVLMMVVHAAAQSIPADYAIRSIRTETSPDRAQITVVFDVVNNGGAASISSTARVLDDTGTTIGSPVTVPPLGQYQSFSVRIEFPTYLFANRAGQIVSLRATVGIDEIEPAGTESASDNNARISLPIPANLTGNPAGQINGTPQAAPTPGGTITVESLLRGDPITIGSFTIPDGRLLIIGVVIALFVLLILIWVITIVLRLLFSRAPVFPNWQPPYAPAAYLDPNSLAGRRGLWQPHAQSDSLPVPCQPGTFAARKLLLGVNGAKLNDWRVVGIRLNQYDMYGRVARSQVIGDPRTVRGLDRLARRSVWIDMRRAERRVSGISRKLTKEFKRRLNKRSAMLPLALDVRLDGRHGEVRMIFELHQCVGDAYQPVDSWEPEVVVTANSGIIHENFTYTLYGQRQGESTGKFIKRLRADMTHTLAQMIAGKAPAVKPIKPAPKNVRSAPAPTPPAGTVPPAPVTPPEITGGDTAQMRPDNDPTPTPGSTSAPGRSS